MLILLMPLVNSSVQIAVEGFGSETHPLSAGHITMSLKKILNIDKNRETNRMVTILVKECISQMKLWLDNNRGELGHLFFNPNSQK